LVPEADTEHRQASGKMADRLDRDPGLFRRARAWRDDQPLRMQSFDLLQRDLVVAIDPNILPQFAKVLNEVVCERIVVIDHQ
jgi:hypothetical protein